MTVISGTLAVTLSQTYFSYSSDSRAIIYLLVFVLVHGNNTGVDLGFYDLKYQSYDLLRGVYGRRTSTSTSMCTH